MRIIATIGIKNNFVIKGINLKGLRKVGNSYAFITKYYEQGIIEFKMKNYIRQIIPVYK